jgi:hypothetical protein
VDCPEAASRGTRATRQRILQFASAWSKSGGSIVGPHIAAGQQPLDRYRRLDRVPPPDRQTSRRFTISSVPAASCKGTGIVHAPPHRRDPTEEHLKRKPNTGSAHLALNPTAVRRMSVRFPSRSSAGSIKGPKANRPRGPDYYSSGRKR